MEYLVIRLGDYREIPPDDILYVPAGRPAPTTHSCQGWRKGMSTEEAWHSAQGWWRLKASRAIDAPLAIVVNKDDEIVSVADIHGIVKGGDNRRWLLGQVDDGEHAPWIGRRLHLNKSRNPTTYLDARDLTPPDQVTEDTEYVNEKR